MLILNPSEVRQALPVEQAISAMKEAFAALSAGHANVPHRATSRSPSMKESAW